MRLIYRGIPWGAQLDQGDGIDLWRQTMGRMTLARSG